MNFSASARLKEQILQQKAQTDEQGFQLGIHRRIGEVNVHRVGVYVAVPLPKRFRFEEM